MDNISYALERLTPDEAVCFLNRAPDSDALLLSWAQDPQFFYFLALIAQSSLPKPFYTPRFLDSVIEQQKGVEEVLDELVLVVPDYSYICYDNRFITRFFALRARCTAATLQVFHFILYLIVREFVLARTLLDESLLMQIQQWADGMTEKDTAAYHTSFEYLNESAFHYMAQAARILASNGYFVDLRAKATLGDLGLADYLLALNRAFPAQVAGFYGSEAISALPFVDLFLDYLRQGNPAAQIMQANGSAIYRLLTVQIYENPDIPELVARLEAQGCAEQVQEISAIIAEMEGLH